MNQKNIVNILMKHFSTPYAQKLTKKTAISPTCY